MTETQPCVFCDTTTPRNAVFAQTKTCHLRLDIYPVAMGHTLIIPNRHVVSVFELTQAEILDVHALMRKAAALFPADGYTVGVNEGEAAGRTIHHLHLHVIPRRHGDVPDPRGGVRRILPGGDVMPWAE